MEAKGGLAPFFFSFLASVPLGGRPNARPRLAGVPTQVLPAAEGSRREQQIPPGDLRKLRKISR